ncbi:RNase P subunit p30-domain-containing protein [Cantharellus anzutake]|uniref:RNase P subunit p30-domain-containing protein n=1 Tax=Cantharellus anzutake TaxID=1750568 RepID=UPI00190570B6|nr:RNase P subunit p30-domain-containing protein [Cantharellus anzutake]KAF8342894.1 RNase P subunit p30-domain-containing protein [Cantharellus anzutake]
MSFYFKHSLIRTAIRNGVVFEIPYAPVISPNSEYRRRTWWANAMELCRMTNGKNIIFGSGTKVISDLRAPLDVANLGTLLSLSQDVALNALTKTPKALILRAQTRKTYRAMVSAPKIVYPSGWPSEGVDAVAAAAESEGDVAQLSVPSKRAAAEAVDTIPSSTRQGKRRKKKKNEEASPD